MDGTTLVILAIVALVTTIALFVGFGVWRGPRALYIRREALFTADEATMLRRLENALSDDYLVMPRLAVIEMVDLRPRLSRRSRRHARNRIFGMHFDFVVVSRLTLTPVCAVILVPPSRSRGQRRRHRLLERLCSSVGIRLLQLETDVLYDGATLRRLVGEEPKAARTPDDPARREPVIADLAGES